MILVGTVKFSESVCANLHFYQHFMSIPLALHSWYCQVLLAILTGV